MKYALRIGKVLSKPAGSVPQAKEEETARGGPEGFPAERSGT